MKCKARIFDVVSQQWFCGGRNWDKEPAAAYWFQSKEGASFYIKQTYPGAKGLKVVCRELDMATPDPLITATRKAYRASPVYALDKLLEEESRWKRKQTIARNKLEEVRDKISKLAKELATPTSSLFSQAKREERGGDK